MRILKKVLPKYLLLIALLVVLSLPVAVFSQPKSSPQDVRNVIHPQPQEVLTAGTGYDIQWVNVKPHPVAYMVIYTRKGNFTIGPADSNATHYLWHIPDTLHSLCWMQIKDATTNDNIGWVDSFEVVPASAVASDPPKEQLFSRQILAQFPIVYFTEADKPDSYQLYSILGGLIEQGDITGNELLQQNTTIHGGIYELVVLKSSEVFARSKVILR